MIVMTMSELNSTSHLATTDWNNTKYSASSSYGASMALARKLIDDGCPDQEWRVVFPNGKLRFYGPSLFKIAKYAIGEGRKVHFVKFDLKETYDENE